MNFQEIIGDDDNRSFNYFVSEIFLGIFGDDRKKSDKLIWMVLGLMALVATEPFKLLLRKNIGNLALSMRRLIIASALYILWAAIIYSSLSEGYSGSSDLQAFWTDPIALWAVVAFYSIFGIGVLILGIKERIQVNSNERNAAKLIHRGDSIFFNTTIAAPYSERKRIWTFSEPGACLVIALFLTALNPFLGGPLVATSIAFWINEYIEANNKWNIMGSKVQNHLTRLGSRLSFQLGQEDSFMIE